MANAESDRPLEPRVETIHPKGSSDGVTIRNDSQYDALLYLNNSFWGDVSVGYARSGESITLPTIVNVDAHAL